MANICEKCKRNETFTIGSKQGTLCNECINEIANDWEDISDEDLICEQCQYVGDRVDFIIMDTGHPWCANCFGNNMVILG